MLRTVNVNGIRATHRRGFGDWLDARGCDVVAVQEIRARAGKPQEDAFGGYHAALGTGDVPGRNGVAVLTRGSPVAVRTWSGNALLGGPHAGAGDLREVPAGFGRYLTGTRRAALASGREFLLMGDMNIAHTRRDLTHWRRDRRHDGFLPEGREWFDRQLSPRTLVDVVRSRHPDEDGPYPWWSWAGAVLREGRRLTHRLPPGHAPAGRCGGRRHGRPGPPWRPALGPLPGGRRLRPGLAGNYSTG